MAAAAPRAIGSDAGQVVMTFYKLKCLFRHLWLDADDTRAAVSEEMLARLTELVAASEDQHTGQVRICVEAGLPLSYIWRLSHDCTMAQLVRQRAMMMFGKLAVWDTEHNNGVLVYLLLGEHAIEIIADRGLSHRVSVTHWKEVVAHLSHALRQGRFEEGISQALAEASALLVAHYPAHPANGEAQRNELPDEPFLR
ncbi:MAG: hypothetical protein JWP47_2457 [Polaromonas sp.]|nr:hypothetical protein [Polaromonas sp.]